MTFSCGGDGKDAFFGLYLACIDGLVFASVFGIITTYCLNKHEFKFLKKQHFLAGFEMRHHESSEEFVNN